MLSFHSTRGRTAIQLGLYGWLRGTIFYHLSSLILKPCPSHPILSLIVALEKGIEIFFFSYSLLLDIRSVQQIPKPVHRRFLWNTSNKSSSIFLKRSYFKTSFHHCHYFRFQYSNLSSLTYLPMLIHISK